MFTIRQLKLLMVSIEACESCSGLVSVELRVRSMKRGVRAQNFYRLQTNSEMKYLNVRSNQLVRFSFRVVWSVHDCLAAHFIRCVSAIVPQQPSGHIRSACPVIFSLVFIKDSYFFFISSNCVLWKLWMRKN